MKHKRLGTRNVLRDLKRNLAKHDVLEMVTVIKGYSFDPATVSAVQQALGPDETGLFILDADERVTPELAQLRPDISPGDVRNALDHGKKIYQEMGPARLDIVCVVAWALAYSGNSYPPGSSSGSGD